MLLQGPGHVFAHQLGVVPGARLQGRDHRDAGRRIAERHGDIAQPSLVAGATDARSPTHAKLYFLRRLPRDPFNRDSSLDAADTWGKRSYASERMTHARALTFSMFIHFPTSGG